MSERGNVVRIANFNRVSDENNKDILTVSESHFKAAKYPEFLPSWDTKEKYPPLKFFEHNDRGLKADKSLSKLFPKNGDYKLRKITPKLGTEVRGVQLSQLSDSGKDELAYFVAQRGLVVFRDQDFVDKGPDFASQFGKYFGPLHIHPTSGAPKNYPEFHIVYRRADEGFQSPFFKRNNLIQWHSDVSYELQPPGITFFTVIEKPESGGDTLYADTVEAYKRLSPAFQKILEGLHVVHSSHEQAKGSSIEGGIVRREPVSNIHPLVRVHPVTGEKILYVNPGFSRKVVELKKDESDLLLNFLYQHIAYAHDLQARASWEPNSVAIWDNRRVVHSATHDFEFSETRHAFRITPQAERPVADLGALNTYSENNPQEAVY
ncbi:Piso0_000430 [Millerozyma farinosa CBS 7064]|uniref:Piso0_000430 protein n=1 Tax=Pichia sorbitophila (strain ATCC MYA-4447 / BCRC 22081 / CBS 7064 / NBRC 10061 / NRRL Y-12695) TaxID=559304 RepID=G8YTZ3_PICSO|nr:Piso0_000430 [Millerozyma farinosa CBS 7064]CCE73394.1 Piso0_000430 [Millerozyma farinosa CBS 7064]